MISNDKIDLYLDGQLKDSELEEFKHQLEHDQQLKAEVKLQQEINESISDDEVYYLRQKLTLLISQTSRKRILVRALSGVAAGLILILSFFSITNSPSPSKAYAEYYTPYETDLNTRSADNSLLGLNFAYKLYSEGEYNTAYELLSNYNSENYNNISAKYYQALCAIELDMSTEAEQNLLEVLNDGDYAYTLHAKWYLSMLYLKSERFDDAEVYLEDLSSDQNFYAARAKKILKKHF